MKGNGIKNTIQNPKQTMIGSVIWKISGWCFI